MQECEHSWWNVRASMMKFEQIVNARVSWNMNEHAGMFSELIINYNYS